MSQNSSLVEALKEREDEIKTGLRITGQALEAAYSVHQSVESEEKKTGSEIGSNESQAERDTYRSIEGVKEEEKDVEEAEKGIKKGLDTIGGLIRMLGEEEHSLDVDIGKLEDMADKLRNNPSGIDSSDLQHLVDLAGQSYSMLEDEIQVEGRISEYLIEYATDLEEAAEEEQALESDLEHLEEETQAEAQRTGHKKRLKKLMTFEEKESEEFKQEVSKLKDEMKEEDQEIQNLQQEVVHTKEEVESLENTLSRIISITGNLGYGRLTNRLEEILENVESDREKLGKVERELKEGRNRMDGAESQAASI